MFGSYGGLAFQTALSPDIRWFVSSQIDCFSLKLYFSFRLKRLYLRFLFYWCYFKRFLIRWWSGSRFSSTTLSPFLRFFFRCLYSRLFNFFNNLLFIFDGFWFLFYWYFYRFLNFCLDFCNIRFLLYHWRFFYNSWLFLRSFIFL